MHLFDDSVVDVKNSRLIPNIKSQVVNEITKEIIVVWNNLNLPVQSKENIRARVKLLVEDLDKIKRHRINQAGIEATLGKYNNLFDVSLREVAINDESNEISLIENDAMEIGDEEVLIPGKRAIKRPAKYQEFFDDGSYFEALSVADQCADDDDWSPDEVDAISVPDYDKYKSFIEIGERFNWSSYQIALGINSLLVNFDKNYLVTQGKVLRMKILFGKEKIAEHKLKGPMMGLQVDAKEVTEALPNCKSHRTNMLTVVRLPQNDYEDHFKANGDTGEIVAEGCIRIIEATQSKDTLLVTGSDGAPNNTSEKTGTHVRIEKYCDRPLQRGICNKHTTGIFSSLLIYFMYLLYPPNKSPVFIRMSLCPKDHFLRQKFDYNTYSSTFKHFEKK